VATKVLFLDRDGTLICEPDDYQVDSLEKVRLVDGVIPALLRLRDSGYRFVIVSNQDGLGTSSFPEEHYRLCQEHMLAIFTSQGINFDEIYVCPHTAADVCECRKPRTGLLTQYLASTNLDTDHSAVIGDRTTDLELAHRIGVRGYMLTENGSHESSWAGISDAICNSQRIATVERNTKETSIRATVNLDSSATAQVATGIGFFDHMLEQIAKHGNFMLRLDCDGDLHIDEHHTVEDTAICLGTALRQALGDKRGIERFGFLLPMDESEAQVSIDLSGRGALVFNGVFPAERVGGLSIEMVEHFFLSFSDSLGASLHINVHGKNSHHMVEACFKAVGRALRQAFVVVGGDLPSTKGVLA
jgi:imidazoleglycerol-phosphate dehydratase/histidinol-phosphatase